MAGKGNPKGTNQRTGIKNKWTLLSNEARQQLADRNDGITPLQFLLSLLRQEDTPIKHRFEAAKIAAPYFHRRMPIAIEGGDPSKPLQIQNQAALRNLTPEELSVLAKIGIKLD